MICAATVWALPAPGRKVVIVLSSPEAPRRQVETEILARLEKANYAARTVLLDQLTQKRESMDPAADAVIAVGTDAAVWLNGSAEITAPLIYCMVPDPRAAGLCRSRQGRCTCGVSVNVPLASQFRLISEALPKARSLGMLYRLDEQESSKLPRAVQDALPPGWRLHAVAVDKHDSVAQAIEELLGRDIDLVWTGPDAAVYNVPTIRSLLLTAMRRNVPVFGFSPALVRAGALLGIGIDPAGQADQIMELLERVLGEGRRPPAQTQPAKLMLEPRFEIAVNLIVAEKLSIKLPEALVKRARHVVRPPSKSAPPAPEARGP